MSDSQRKVPHMPPGVPKWLKFSGAILALLILVVIAVLLISGGEHGPSRHGAERAVTPASPAASLAGLRG